MHTVMFRRSIACALGSEKTRMAASTRSRFGLTHALEDDAVGARALGKLGAHEPQLFDDFPGFEVAVESHATGRAERAGERTAHLGADTNGKSPWFFQRNAYGLYFVLVVRAEGVLHERVERAGASFDNAQRRERAAPLDCVESCSPYRCR